MSRNPFERPRSYYLTALAFLVAGLIAGLGLSMGLGIDRASNAQQGAAIRPAATANVLSSAPESPFVSVVDKALPAVVFIDVRRRVGGDEDSQEDLFRRLFPDGNQRRGPQVRPSSGSGFIIDAQGHILTNNHVVRDAQEITVTLNDRRTFRARTVGTDPETDLAVIKIDGDKLPVLPLGDSDRIRVGDWAIAIGNPLGELRGSVTVGIISAQGRSNLNIFGGTPAFQDFIQTDASINFGNSGGPLCNIRGEAIGINTAINPSGQGIGFAIPINLAKHVAGQLVAGGKVQRSMLGVNLAELTPEIAEGFGLSSVDGVLIQGVIRGQPAERAGLQRNDVIVEYNGEPVTDLQKFRLRIADSPVGSKVNLVVLRDGKRVPVTVTLAARDQTVLAQAQPGNDPQASQPSYGLTVRPLTAEEARAAQVEKGVLVTRVQGGSAAEEAGLQEGDVIEEIGGKPVDSPAAFERLLGDAARSGKRNAALLVVRNGNTQFVPLRLSDGR